MDRAAHPAVPSRHGAHARRSSATSTTRVITPQELLRRALARTRVAGRRDARHRLPARASPPSARASATASSPSWSISPVKRLGGLGVAAAHARCSAFLDERLPEPGPRGGRSRLVVLAGPTAVGKGTVAAHITEHHPEILLSVSATTRPPRPGEVDGEHYFFVDDAEFDRLIAADELLEHATVHNQYRYGTPARPDREPRWTTVEPCCSRSTCRARARCEQHDPSATLVFLLPPSWDELVHRLVGRGTEDAEERARRLRTAKVELAAQNEFDYRVVNEDVASAAARS